LHDAVAFRDWHFDHLPVEMDDWPHVVNGSFVRVVCEDLQFSFAVVELIDRDYHRRYFPLKALADADQQRIISRSPAVTWADGFPEVVFSPG
jgi:hypothetical protein